MLRGKREKKKETSVRGGQTLKYNFGKKRTDGGNNQTTHRKTKENARPRKKRNR